MKTSTPSPDHPSMFRRNRPVRRFTADELERLQRVAEGSDGNADAVRILVSLIGGVEHLALLDDAPLPDEPFDWSAVEGDDRAVVAVVLDHADRWCDELFDVELRTAVRRLLARLCRTQPAALRKGADERRVAAALVWLVGRGNGAVGLESGFPDDSLWARLGVRDSSRLGRKLRDAAGVAADVPDAWAPDGRPDWLADLSLLTKFVRGLLFIQLDSCLGIEVPDVHDVLPVTPFVEELDGHVTVRPPVLAVVDAIKGVDRDGRVHVLCVFGEDEAPHIIAVSVSDARRLRDCLGEALDDPIPAWP